MKNVWIYQKEKENNSNYTNILPKLPKRTYNYVENEKNPNTNKLTVDLSNYSKKKEEKNYRTMVFF